MKTENKVRIVLRPIAQSFTNTRFPAAYRYNNKIRVWKEDDTIEDVELDAELPKRKNIIFDTTRHFYSILWENTKKLTSYEERKQEIYVKFLCNHPECLINGERHTNSKSQNPIFEVVDLNKAVQTKVLELEKRFAAIDMVRNMSEGQREEIMYWYGASPQNKDSGEIFISLIDLQTGLCVKDAENFINTWKEVGTETQFVVNIRKAIDTKVVEERVTTAANGEATTSYYVSNNWCGVSFNDVLAYMKENPKVYEEHVLRMINKGVKSAANVVVHTDLRKTAKPKIWNEENIKELRAEAKELIKDGFLDESVRYGILSPEKLFTFVEESRKIKSSLSAVPETV